MDERTDQSERSELTVVGTRRRRSRAPRVETRDFRRPARPTGTQLRELEGLANRVAAQIRSTLANRLKSEVTCTSISPEVMSFSEAVESFTAETWLLPLISEAGDRAVLALDGDLQRHLIIRFLGGGKPSEGDDDEDEEPDEDRGPLPVGPISRAAMLPIIRSILKDVGGMLRDETRDTPSTEEDSELYGIDADRLGSPARRWMRPGEAMTSLSYSLTEGTGAGVMTLVVSSSALATLLRIEESSLAAAVHDVGTRTKMESMVRDLGMELCLRLGGATIDLAEFLRLGPGDVLVLDQRVGDALDVMVGSERRFVGQPGRSRGRLAVRIIGRCDQKEES